MPLAYLNIRSFFHTTHPCLVKATVIVKMYGKQFYLLKDLMFAAVQSTNLKSYDTQVLDIMQKAILTTDLARFFGRKEQFQTIVTSGEFSWENDQHRLCQLHNLILLLFLILIQYY